MPRFRTVRSNAAQATCKISNPYPQMGSSQGLNHQMAEPDLTINWTSISELVALFAGSTGANSIPITIPSPNDMGSSDSNDSNDSTDSNDSSQQKVISGGLRQAPKCHCKPLHRPTFHSSARAAHLKAGLAGYWMPEYFWNTIIQSAASRCRQANVSRSTMDPLGFSGGVV